MNKTKIEKQYFEAHLETLLEAVPEARGRIAAGMVGEGSQCFGYDDHLSKDHDFGPGFYIWLTDEDYATFGQKLQDAYNALPDSFQGLSRKPLMAGDRHGVMTIDNFYHRFIDTLSGPPASLLDWFFLPEYQLAAATNGEVFVDGPGVFTDIRNRLLAFYPEDVRRKKIAARAAVMSQAGQYNLLRAIQREDKVTATLAAARFTEAAISMAHLLEGHYTPFYKWGFRSLQELDFGSSFVPHLNRLPEMEASLYEGDFAKARSQAFVITESICRATAGELRRQGITTTSSNFLQDHLPEIMDGIVDDTLRALPPMLDCQN